MRQTSSRGRKTNSNDDLDGNCSRNSVSVQMELEMVAIKAKNTELTKAHAKLVHDNFQMRNEILSLRRELVDAEARSNCLESQFKKFTQNIKKCTPSLLSILNTFLQVPDSFKTRTSLLGVSNRDSEGYTPKAKAVTHTVKPHTVNGTVLNLNPTISLTRLDTSSAQRSPGEPINGNVSSDFRNSLPSTSGHEENVENNILDENINTDLDTVDDELVRRRSQNQRTTLPLITVDAPSEMEVDNEVESELEDPDGSLAVRRLTTISEESIGSNANSRNSLGEIRICLSRLAADDMGDRKSCNDTYTSTEAHINDTCLNIETTVIESQETRVSKRLRTDIRTDIMVFSPQTNSTRLDPENSTLNNLSLGQILETSVPAINSAEVTPTTSFMNDDNRIGAKSALPWVPTPSMSAMGDIDKSNYLNLDILNVPDKKLSPRSASPYPPRVTRSKGRRRIPSQQQPDDSPRSSRENNTQRKSKSSELISQPRGASGGKVEKVPTPTITLERLESNSLGSNHIRSSRKRSNNDDPKENENIPNNIYDDRPKKSKAKNRSKSPKRSLKRKKNDEHSLQDTIREIQIRLSNYVPNENVDAPESPKNCSRRPSRAVKPKVLKDASLKGKLRRMF